MINRHPGKILERGIDDVIIIPDPANGGVRVISLDNRIVNHKATVLSEGSREGEDGNKNCDYEMFHIISYLVPVQKEFLHSIFQCAWDLRRPCPNRLGVNDCKRDKRVRKEP